MADTTSQNAEVVIGEDWEKPGGEVERALKDSRNRRGLLTLHRSPLARKIILFNLLALMILLAGILYLNPFRESLVVQREHALVSEARLVANAFEARLPRRVPANLGTGDGIDVEAALASLDLPGDADLRVFDTSGALIAEARGNRAAWIADDRPTHIMDGVDWMRKNLLGAFRTNRASPAESTIPEAASQVETALNAETAMTVVRDQIRSRIFMVSVPIRQGETVVGAVTMSTASGEIDALVRVEREQLLQLFLIAIIVSVGLSVVLAGTIANPLSDLVMAVEIGRDKRGRKMKPNRIRIPDLTARPDEIGRLSGALRGMVMALYDRIDANEQFAADVSHEIKNPLASLRSAVGTLQMAKRDDQREKLLGVIDHDIRRLDRLVSDISNASRLDSELVKAEERSFDLVKTLRPLIEFHGTEAAEHGIDFIADLPKQPVLIDGLEGRLAQVFVNLITNAMSFCKEGDAVRIWVRQRENRVLVVVEDTGPGIPEQALSKIFKRFYSERPENQFGDHSGLGLAISKQIVEAHGGVIWAENIRPTDADITSQPLGARFVVGLPV